MSQESVLKYLKNKKNWKTTKEISKSVNVSCSLHSLVKLFNQGEVIRKESCSNGRKIYLWSTK